VGLSMDLRLNGSLGGSLLPDLIREIARRGASGALRLSQDNAARFIYFDLGTPVSLTSELADEQLENRLLKEGRTTAGLIQAARRAKPKSQLSRALVEKGALSEDAVRLTTGELVKQIVLSIFEWEGGEYHFDEGAQPAEAGALDCTPADWIRGARHAAGIERLANLIAPPDLLIAPADTNSYFLASLPALNTIESYVLSRIEAPARVDEVSGMVGLPEAEAHRAVCVLVALGLLARSGCAAVEDGERGKKQQDPMLAAVSRKLQLFESADYYVMLGVDKFATAATVTTAFEELQRMFSSYHALSSDDEEFHIKLKELYAKVTAAYQTLSDPSKRWAYDRAAAKTSSSQASPPGSGSNLHERSNGSLRSLISGVPSPSEHFVFESTIERGESHSAERASVRTQSAAAIEPSPHAGQAELQAPKRAPIPGLASAAIELPSVPPGATLVQGESVQQANQPQWVTEAQTALRFYRQGRARYEERDVNGANHLFREACKLDPTQAHYHFYLAMTLIVLSQARREHAHHEGCHVTCSLGGSLVSNPRMRYEAEQHFLRAAELDPGNATIPLRLGLLFKEAGLTKKAEHYFHETLLRDGNNKTALAELELLEQTSTRGTGDLNNGSAED